MYHFFEEIIIDKFNDNYISELYSRGFKFTRIGRGVLQSSRSIRVNLDKFELNSENRRILRKNSTLNICFETLPYKKYDWKVGKSCKDFYLLKFHNKIFSISKIKELFAGDLNLNSLFTYKYENELNINGYCLAYTNNEIIHYCYPFYDLKFNNSSLGIGMMTSAIVFAKNNNKKYIYLGSYNSERDRYKLQFKGIEIWDNDTQLWISL